MTQFLQTASVWACVAAHLNV
eukprot:COSAG06_NODE_65360_length_257_cov_0.651899_1_plen_20_part_10